jgi:serine/threonine-protein phosphatase 2B catalytic subunit
MLKKDPNLV